MSNQGWLPWQCLGMAFADFINELRTIETEHSDNGRVAALKCMLALEVALQEARDLGLVVPNAGLPRRSTS